ncbi:FMN-binding negative transcriptional regulator [Undibacterium sp. FT147W]|uniref:FMN-binding negative transcriptional regulator n=1 Tax=Undibacterium rivi TaxID=2828729 RepID=A0ABS5H700_9BURK|nr:FMN-binding negative transcriptional regulator [Undibacterium rivi]MBR7794278.1 FMN-binding negative transcriptional regulator [Undibacterium rivi]
MYTPAAFSEQKIEVLHALIDAHPLASIVTSTEDGMTADHIPMIITAPSADAPFGTLRGHVARQNPLWQYPSEMLCIFQGPSAYITPSWYEEKKQNGAVVPTYNYAVVHAYGKLRIVDNQQEFLALLNSLTTHFEEQRTMPWHISDAPSDYIHHLMESIVGIEIPITRITGKWKASQNKITQNRINIAMGLREENNQDGIAMADLMEQALFAPKENNT